MLARTSLTIALAVILVSTASAQGTGNRVILRGQAEPLTIARRDASAGVSGGCPGGRRTPCPPSASATLRVSGRTRHGAIRELSLAVDTASIGPVHVDLGDRAAQPARDEEGCLRVVPTGYLSIERADGVTHEATTGSIDVEVWRDRRARGSFDVQVPDASPDSLRVRGTFDVALPAVPLAPPCQPMP